MMPATAHCAPLKKRVIVIGAGMAGLGAARDLQRAGFEVIIVEARDRIGGRTHTSRLWPDLPMDLGASWIHGLKGNPVTALAREAGAAMVTTSYDSANNYVDPALTALGLTDPDDSDTNALIAKAIRKAGQGDVDISLQAALDGVAPPQSLNAIQRAELDFAVSGTYEMEYAGSAAQMSAWTIDDNESLPGDDALFPGGYVQIVDHLAKGLDIRLKKVVTRVNWRGPGVTITLGNGETLSADHVIVTVPLGVLKAGSIAFDPPLPAPKQQAISRIGMGLLNKAWLRFDRVYWPAAYDWHSFLSPDKGRWSEWVSLAKIAQTPVLLAFSAADRADRIEKMSDAQIVADAMQAARTMFGSSIPDPIAVQITRWRADPFALGSYSFNAVGSSNADRSALARSERGLLYFAGEATNARYPGTVHGALISGQASAGAIIKTGRSAAQAKL